MVASMVVTVGGDRLRSFFKCDNNVRLDDRGRYWNIRGLASPIRYLLELMGASYSEVRYHAGEASSGYDLSEWTRVKHTLGCEHPVAA